MREVLISIQPKWVEKICRGEKTVEVRKTKPKREVPFRCYIYCTKGKPTFTQSAFCDDISNGKVIGEFVCDRIIDIPCKDLFENFRRLVTDIITPSCLKVEQIKNYLGYKDGYGWHISDLVVYDEPRELSEFETFNCSYVMNEDGYPIPSHHIKSPPQSWFYVKATEPRQTAD